MRKISDQISAQLLSNPNIQFCFIIKLLTGEILYLTNGQEPIVDKDIVYQPNSSLQITKAIFSDDARDSIELRGIFEDGGLLPKHQISDAQVDILAYFNDNEPLMLLFSWYCINVTKHNTSVHLQLQPISTQFNRICTEKYSPTCRTEFGDKRCKVDLAQYSKKFAIKEIQDNIVMIDAFMEEHYYTYGEATISSPTSVFKARIIRQLRDRVELDLAPIPEIRSCMEITLTAGCDKRFSTCCNKFNNAINFRGEPFIEDLRDNKLKIHNPG